MRLHCITSLLLFGLVCANNGFGKGLKVAPAGYRWQDVRLGSRAELPVKIRIRNESAGARSYVLRVCRPEELPEKPGDGFEELPAREWIEFEPKQVTIGPGAWGEAAVFVNVPRVGRNFGRRWRFYVEIKERASAGEKFALACYPRFYITMQAGE